MRFCYSIWQNVRGQNRVRGRAETAYRMARRFRRTYGIWLKLTFLPRRMSYHVVWQRVEKIP